MAQQKALTTQFGQGPEGLKKRKEEAAGQEGLTDLSDFIRPVQQAEDDDIIPPDTAIPNTPRGLPEQQPDQGIAAQQREFVGPYSPEFYQGLQATQRPDAFTIPPAYREMYGMSDIPFSPQETGLDLPPEEREKRLNDLIDRGELGTSIALGVAFPGMGLLGISTTAGALNYVKNTLKNQLVPDATKKDEVERGQVLAKPGSVTPHTEFEGEVYVLTKEEGGRHKPFFKGYKPQFYIRTTDVTGEVDLPEGTEMVMPGDTVNLKIKLIAPIAMEEKQRFAIREGGKTVGAGVVTKIVK